MNVSSLMAKQVAELQHTLSMNLLSSQMATQTAQATVMLQDFQAIQSAPHPYKGLSVDIKG